MDDAGGVSGLEGLEHLADVVDGLRDGQRAGAFDDVGEGEALDVLHDYVVGGLILACIEDAHDVRFGEGAGSAGLTEEAFDQLGIAGEMLMEDFDGDDGIGTQVAAEEDIGEAASAYELGYSVCAV